MCRATTDPRGGVRCPYNHRRAPKPTTLEAKMARAAEKRAMARDRAARYRARRQQTAVVAVHTIPVQGTGDAEPAGSAPLPTFDTPPQRLPDKPRPKRRTKALEKAEERLADMERLGAPPESVARARAKVEALTPDPAAPAPAPTPAPAAPKAPAPVQPQESTVPAVDPTVDPDNPFTPEAIAREAAAERERVIAAGQGTRPKVNPFAVLAAQQAAEAQAAAEAARPTEPPPAPVDPANPFTAYAAERVQEKPAPAPTQPTPVDPTLAAFAALGAQQREAQEEAIHAQRAQAQGQATRAVPHPRAFAPQQAGAGNPFAAAAAARAARESDSKRVIAAGQALDPDLYAVLAARIEERAQAARAQGMADADLAGHMRISAAQATRPEELAALLAAAAAIT